MKAFFLGILLIVGMSQSFAQKKQKIAIQSLSDIKIDADLSEWDTLHNVADQGFWFYQLAQDASNLYLAIRVEDYSLHISAILSGIVFSVIPDKKNRDEILFLYPYTDREAKRAINQEGYRSEEEEKRAFIERSRGYFVYGFPTIPSGLLSFQNEYGLRAKIRTDEGTLYYEAVIPKSLLDYTKPLAILKLAIHDGITPLVAPKKSASTRSGGMYRPYRGRPTPRSKDIRIREVLLEAKID